MSYILDALKKAEAERRVGTPAGPHALPPVAHVHQHGERKGPMRSPWPWMALTAAAALVAVYSWLRPSPAPSPAMPQAVPQAAPQTPAQTTVQPSSQTGVPAPAVPVEAPKQQVAAAQPLAPPVQPPTSTAQPPAASSQPIVEDAPEPPKPKTAKAPKSAEKPHLAAKAKPAEAKPAEPPAPPVPTLRELPDNIQREIPQLSVGGYIYSGNKADRSVLINGRLLHEGEEVAPGLMLEKMMPNGMVLRYKGYRYRTGY